MKKRILSIIATILFASIYYYIALPPLNFTNMSFWMFIIILIIFYYCVSTLTTLNIHKINLKNPQKKVSIILS